MIALPCRSCPTPRSVFLFPTPGLGWQILRQLLTEIPGATVVGEATTPKEALAALPTLAPDLVLSSPVLAGESMLATLAALHHACPSTTLALFAADLAPAALRLFAAVGVRGYLSWDLDDTSVRGAVMALLAGQVFVSSVQLAATIVASSAASAPPLRRCRSASSGCCSTWRQAARIPRSRREKAWPCARWSAGWRSWQRSWVHHRRSCWACGRRSSACRRRSLARSRQAAGSNPPRHLPLWQWAASTSGYGG